MVTHVWRGRAGYLKFKVITDLRGNYKDRRQGRARRGKEKTVKISLEPKLNKPHCAKRQKFIITEGI